MGKLLLYDSLVSKINDKIDLIKRYGKDTSLFEEKLSTILNDDIEFPPYLNESNNSQSIRLTNEIKYNKKIKELENLLSELENYEKYTNIYFKTMSLKNSLNNLNIDDKTTAILMQRIEQGKAILNELENIDDYQDSEEERKLNYVIYKTMYEIIKFEIILYGNSSLLGYILCNNKGIEFINDFVREDLYKIDLGDESNQDINNKLLELLSNGTVYADKTLIFMILLRTDHRLIDNIDYKINELKQREKDFDEQIKKLNDDLKTSRDYKTMVKAKRKKARIKALITTGFILLNGISYKLFDTVVKNHCTDITYDTTREVYDTYTGKVSNSSALEYKTGDDYVYILEYSDVNKNGSRQLQSKTIKNDLHEDIKDYGQLDIDFEDSSSKRYSSIDQITKEKYRAIEKVTYDSEAHVETDTESYEKIMKIILYCELGLTSLQTLLLLRYLLIALSSDIKNIKADKTIKKTNNRKSHYDHYLKHCKQNIDEFEEAKKEISCKTLSKDKYFKIINN